MENVSPVGLQIVNNYGGCGPIHCYVLKILQRFCNIYIPIMFVSKFQILQKNKNSVIYLPPVHTSSDICFFPIGLHVNMPSGKMGYLITETKFDRNFPLFDSRYIKEYFSLYEKNWEKIASASIKFPNKLKKIFVFALNLLKVSVADIVKFALLRVKSVNFFSRIFISHVEDFDLFGGFTDLVFFFQVSFCMLPTWNFRKFSEIRKL